MLITTLILVGIEIASLLIAAAVIGQYTRVNRRTASLVSSLGGTPPRTYMASIVYAVSTLLIGIITAALYVFQPHLL
jgi:hypothetical protein